MDRMIVTKGQPNTRDIISCEYNDITHKWDVTYKGGKHYSYSYRNIEVLKNSRAVETGNALFYYENRLLSYNAKVYEFSGKGKTYYRFIHDAGFVEEYASDQLHIERSCITEKNGNILDYLKEISSINQMKNDQGERLLEKQYAQIETISNKTALADYIQGRNQRSDDKKSVHPIFPFGCNKSQYEAVCNALTNKISIIQGPPGTGKTQTILNIISNLLVKGFTVQVVSYNNSAIDNIIEKLNANNIGFVSAFLGKQENKSAFIDEQTGKYPDFTEWISLKDKETLFEEVQNLSKKTHSYFDLNEEAAVLRQEKVRLDTEYNHFRNKMGDPVRGDLQLIKKKNASSKSILHLMDILKNRTESGKSYGLLFRIMLLYRYGMKLRKADVDDLGNIFDWLQDTYYKWRRVEIVNRIETISKDLKKEDGLLNKLSEVSMEYLKNYLAVRYSVNKGRVVFDNEDLWKDGASILKEYPVILSTTFSAKNTLGSRLMPVVYDYVIMDEASQVDVATGALALYSARNAVVVGDMMQLPNVLTNDDRVLAKEIFNRYKINNNYLFTNSFLKSVLMTISGAPEVMLREHYRCHPKIIEFCNQKFYQGRLIVMTEDKVEKDVLKVYLTNEGNHARGHYNQRQIDVIKSEIINEAASSEESIGIITPYRDQVIEMRKELPENIKIDTVHKFQGREEDMIILSTVDNKYNEFSDDPNLINVAVSRAKKKLYVVSSGNESAGNIHDLIEYVRYNNFEIEKSSISSVFDYLYFQYTQMLHDKLKDKKRVSEYDSENLMYDLLQEVIIECGYPELEVLCHMSLRNLIRDASLLNEDEKRYALHPCTHIDFSVVNRVTKKYLLAIEVDGYAFHNKETLQSQRDVKKNHIFEKYNIPYLRFSTTGSNEKEILINKLIELMSISTTKVENNQETEKYRYYCTDCKKQFKIKGSGKKIKCPNCGRMLYDMKISDTEYDKLDKKERAAIIKSIEL